MRADSYRKKVEAIVDRFKPLEPIPTNEAIAQYNDLLDLAREMAAVLCHGPSHEWTWSLEQPEVSGQHWIETWDERAMALGVMRFTVGDVLPENVAAWRYVDPPARSSATPQQGEKA